MRIKEIINNGIKTLKENKIEDSFIKARILLQYILKKDKTYIVINEEKELDKQYEEIYNDYIKKIANGFPLQYITNNQEFMGFNFFVDENVLIPQPDTEILVEEAIKEIERLPKKYIKILDLCTGSGAIAISISKYLKKKGIKFEMYASDISMNALEIAKKNSKSNDVQISFILSDMFENIEDKFDVVVSNPPYIENEIISKLPKEVQYEPHIALDGGKDGLDFYRNIAENSSKYLKEDGKILLEIGYNQRKKVINVFQEKNYKNISCIKDLSGNDRVIKIN